MLDFFNSMLSYDWDTIFSNYNEITLDAFLNKIKWNMVKHFPRKLTKLRTIRPCPWLYDAIIKSQRDIHDLYHIKRQYPDFPTVNCI